MQGCQKDPLFGSIPPESHSTIGERIRPLAHIQLWIESPEHLPSFRVQSNDFREGSGQIHDSIHHQRRAFKCRCHRVWRSISGVENPGDF